MTIAAPRDPGSPPQRAVEHLESFVSPLAGIDPACFVPFAAQRLARARVVWLNGRWFGEQGIDIAASGVRGAVSDWLIDNFAFSVRSPQEPDDDYLPQTMAFDADRYGGTGGALHGGSGRCGSRKGFQAKGIGRTPLVPENVDWYHSHGFLWLEEALREAVASEIADAELPHGAVPSVAVIDTGTTIVWPDGVRGERRAILIRPLVVRLCHLERSIFFGTAGAKGSSQYEDAVRTAAVNVRQWPDGTAASHLPLLSRRVAEQLVASHVGRYWLGPFYSSNFAVDARTIDFGAFRSVVDWSQSSIAFGDPAFGTEWTAFDEAWASLRYYCRKYAGQRVDVGADARGARRHALRSELATWVDDALVADLEALFVRQQRRSGAILAHDRPEEAGPDSGPMSSDIAPVAVTLRAIWDDGNPARAWAGLCALERIISSRAGYTREAITARLSTLLAEDPMLSTAQDVVDRLAGGARRRWPVSMYRGLVAHRSEHNGAIWQSIDCTTGRCEIVVRARVIDGTVTLFGRTFVPPNDPDDGGWYDMAFDRGDDFAWPTALMVDGETHRIAPPDTVHGVPTTLQAARTRIEFLCSAGTHHSGATIHVPDDEA